MLLDEYTWFHGPADGIKQTRVPSKSPDEAYLIHEVQYVAYGVLAPIILSIGIVGNLLMLLLLRLPQFKGVVFTYFTVLAAADLLSLVFCISPLHHVLAGATLHYSTAVWYSYFELLFVGVATSTSVLVVVSITIHRFFSVCRPAEFKRVNTSRFAWICIAAAFGVSFVSWLPMSFLRKPRKASECQLSSFTPPDNRTWWVACLVHDMGGKGYFVAYVWVRQVLISFLPILIVVSLNMFTLRGFMRHRRMRSTMLNRQVSGQPSDASSTKEEKQLVGLLIAVMSSFVITIIPSGIANAVNISIDTSELNFVIFNAVANLLEILNHTLNFYLYVLCSKPVRNTLEEYYLKYTSDLERIVGSRLGINKDVKEDSTRYSESPTSKPRQSRDSEKITAINISINQKSIFVISCPHLDSSGRDVVLESDLSAENKENENIQDHYFPHVINKRKSDTLGHDNPNFQFD